jgi:hypothetical protein
MIQIVPRPELYRERMLRALARDTQLPQFVIDSSDIEHFDQFYEKVETFFS